MGVPSILAVMKVPSRGLGWPSWIGVVAEDLDAQRRFYRDVLGFAELASGPGWVHFDFGNGNLFEVIQRRNVPEYDGVRCQVGYTVEDIEASRAKLVERGVQIVSEIKGDAETDGRWCYFRDPEGNVFELKERRRR